jgi:hypothetical protein
LICLRCRRSVNRRNWGRQTHVACTVAKFTSVHRVNVNSGMRASHSAAAPRPSVWRAWVGNVQHSIALAKASAVCHDTPNTYDTRGVAVRIALSYTASVSSYCNPRLACKGSSVIVCHALCARSCSARLRRFYASYTPPVVVAAAARASSPPLEHTPSKFYTRAAGGARACLQRTSAVAVSHCRRGTSRPCNPSRPRSDPEVTAIKVGGTHTREERYGTSLGN